MVVCLIALPVLLVLGLFSATHRRLAKEAIRCAVRKVSLRPCDLSLEQKLKKMVFGSILKYNERLAFFVFKNFEGISILFGTLMVLSVLGVGIGAYNFYLYGNCNGAATSEFCVFNPETYSSGIDFFGFRFFETKHSPSEIKPIVLGDAPSIGPTDASLQVIEVGCFTCPYTKAAEPVVADFLQRHEGEIRFSFKYFPLPSHTYSFEAAASAECAREQGKFWEYKEKLFEHQQSCSQSENTQELYNNFFLIAGSLGLDQPQFRQCVESGKYNSVIQVHKQQAIDAGIYGTPTFYVNGKVVVAPKSVDELENAVISG